MIPEHPIPEMARPMMRILDENAIPQRNDPSSKIPEGMKRLDSYASPLTFVDRLPIDAIYVDFNEKYE
jgi:hypothetical protein